MSGCPGSPGGDYYWEGEQPKIYRKLAPCTFVVLINTCS